MDRGHCHAYSLFNSWLFCVHHRASCGTPHMYALSVTVSHLQNLRFSQMGLLRCRSALNPFLLTRVMNRLTNEVRQVFLWTMMFVDNVVINYESREQVEKKLVRQRNALERRGIVSRMKAEYMCVNERERGGNVQVEIVKVDEFKYLGSIILSTGKWTRQMKKRMQTGWSRQRQVSGQFVTERQLQEFTRWQ